MTTFFVPTGLGVGANVETFSGRERLMWQQAMDRLGAGWSYDWGRLDVGPGYVPSIHPEHAGVCSANDLLAWKHRQMARGLPWNGLSWICCNEPEASGKTAREWRERSEKSAQTRASPYSSRLLGWFRLVTPTNQPQPTAFKVTNRPVEPADSQPRRSTCCRPGCQNLAAPCSACARRPG